MTLHQTISAYNLNQGQQNAADKFLEFLFSDQPEFIISGPAGVGKTYLMNYIIDNTMPRYEEMCRLIGERPIYNEVVMTATTNKAADVLSQSVKRPTSTAHNFFNVVVNTDYSTGQQFLRKKKTWKVHEKKIIFVDESSMVDKDLWQTAQDGTMECKIVWVGDRHQLAPVNEDLSPVYKHNAPMVELLEPVRNAGQPALMNICSQLRRTVETGIFEPIEVVPGVIDYLDGSQMQTEINNHFLQQTHAARILAYTNERVVQYNDHIRAIRGLPDSFTPGEYLVTAAMFHHKNGQIPVETEIEVLRNHGPSRILIDEDHDVWLDVEKLDVKDRLGTYVNNVPVMTNRQHHSDLVKYYGSKKVQDWKKKAQLQETIADLRPRDAATVHKSQGSTYDTVFIDLANISGRCHNPNQAARLLYVAFSRARKRVCLYGDLAPKYGGLLFK